jgi:hypothetical protein
LGPIRGACGVASLARAQSPGCALRLAFAPNRAQRGPGFLPPTLQGQVAPAAEEAARCGGLHRAAWRSDVDALERLLATRPDLEARDAHGRTPLQLARERGYGAMVRMLEAARVR